MSYCMNCGHKLMDGARFCQNCGAPVAVGPKSRANSSASTDKSTRMSSQNNRNTSGSDNLNSEIHSAQNYQGQDRREQNDQSQNLQRQNNQEQNRPVQSRPPQNHPNGHRKSPKKAKRKKKWPMVLVICAGAAVLVTLLLAFLNSSQLRRGDSSDSFSSYSYTEGAAEESVSETTNYAEESVSEDNISWADSSETTYSEDESSTDTAAGQSNAASVSWTNYSHIYESPEGYTIQQNIHISQWISYQNEYDLLEDTWNEVSRGNDLPAPASMGCIYSNMFDNGQYKTYIDYDEVYYAVGYLEESNQTANFDLSDSNTLSTRISVLCENTCTSMMVFYSSGWDLYGVDNVRHYFARGEGNAISAKMTSNHWQVPFVIAYVIDKTPANPDGNPAPYNLRLGLGDWDNEFYLSTSSS